MGMASTRQVQGHRRWPGFLGGEQLSLCILRAWSTAITMFTATMANPQITAMVAVAIRLPHFGHAKMRPMKAKKHHAMSA